MATKSHYMGLHLDGHNKGFVPVNVVVPSKSKLTVATCNRIRAIIKYKQLVMALMGEHYLAFG